MNLTFFLKQNCGCVWSSQREIRQGEEIAWYADGETIVRSEHNPSIAYAYGTLLGFQYIFVALVLLLNCTILFVYGLC